MKRCIVCSFVKPLTEYYYEVDKKTLKPACKECVKARARKWQSDNPEQNENNRLKLKYNITLDEKKEMVRQQANRCAICEDVFSDTVIMCVDHCHKTDDVRGILCSQCNTGLGLFRDSKKLLREAIKYLNEHAQKRTAALISAGHNIQGELYPELGSFSASGLRQDGHDPNYHRGAVHGEDPHYRPEEGSRDGMAHRNKKVEPLEGFTRGEDNGDSVPEDGSPEYRGGRLFD